MTHGDDAGSEPDPARTDHLADVLARVAPALDAFLRHAGPDRAAQRSRWRAALDTPLPEHGLGAETVLARLSEQVVAHGLRTGAPGFCGWITTAPALVPAAAAFAASLATPQRWWVSPGNFLELLALRWLAQLLGLPRDRAGSFTSGGAVANLLALAAARQHAGERRGVDPAADGAAVCHLLAAGAGETAFELVGSQDLDVSQYGIAVDRGKCCRSDSRLLLRTLSLPAARLIQRASQYNHTNEEEPSCSHDSSRCPWLLTPEPARRRKKRPAARTEFCATSAESSGSTRQCQCKTTGMRLRGVPGR